MGRSFGGRSFGGGSRGGGFSGGGFGGGSYRGGYGGRHHSSNLIGGLVRIAMFLIAAVVMMAVADNEASPPKVRESTKSRQPLQITATSGDVYYNGWDGDPNDKLIQSMTTFYEETGVTVHKYYITVGKTLSSYNYDYSDYSKYVEDGNFDINKYLYEHIPSIIYDNKETFLVDGKEMSYKWDGDDIFFDSMPSSYEAEAFAQHLYDRLFSDETHMLVLHFYQSWFDYGGEDENVWYYCGEEAATVIDEQAANIFLDYVELHRYNNNNNYINNDIFADALTDTAALIMAPPTYRWVYKTIGWVVGFAVVVAVAIIIYRKIKQKQKLDKEKEQKPEKEQKIITVESTEIESQQTDLMKATMEALDIEE